MKLVFPGATGDVTQEEDYTYRSKPEIQVLNKLSFVLCFFRWASVIIKSSGLKLKVKVFRDATFRVEPIR